MERRPYLQVVLRVPVRVEDDAGVGGGEVDAQAPGARAQQEDEAVRVGLTEAVDGRLSEVAAHPAVDPLIQVSGARGEWNRQVSGHVKHHVICPASQCPTTQFTNNSRLPLHATWIALYFVIITIFGLVSGWVPQAH